MKKTALFVSLSLLACDVPPPDEASDAGVDAGPAPIDLQPGQTADLEAVDPGLRIDLAQAGTYIVTLISTDESQGTSFGYGTEQQKMRREKPDPLPPNWPAAPPLDKINVGDTRSFAVYDGQALVNISAEAKQVTDGVVVWEDTSTALPDGWDIDYDTINGVLALLEDLVVPREEQLFGAISDVDGDGKLAVLISYTVNQYGPTAYVTPCDIGLVTGCGGSSNDGEIIYLSVPDPNPEAARRFSVNGITETVAHELSHLIYGFHKYVQNGTADNENIYLTEGMAALAQDLTGFNNGNQYVWGSAIDTRELYDSDDYTSQALSINDLFRGDSYYNEARDGALRGGSYLFLRYLFEQAGGMRVESNGDFTDLGGIAWLHEIYNMPEQGIAAIELSTGTNIWALTLDWYTAIVATGRGVEVDPRLRYQDRVEDPITGYSYGVDPFATIHGWLHLPGPPVQSWDSPDGQIRAGGVEYLQIEAKPGLLELSVGAEVMGRARILRVE